MKLHCMHSSVVICLLLAIVVRAYQADSHHPELGATLPVFSGDRGNLSAVGKEENLALAKIAQRMYAETFVDKQTARFAYKRDCVPGTFLDVYTESSFVSWLIDIPAMNALVLSFRGTSNLDNLKDDINFLKTDCLLEGLSCGQVHKGFLSLWEAHRDSTKAAIAKFAAVNKNKIPQLLVTGHSLGAAVAQIAALELGQLFSVKQSIINQIQVISFGTPRTGDMAFTKVYAKFRPDPVTLTRFALTLSVLGVTFADPITEIPLEPMGFEHIGGDSLTTALKCTLCKPGLKMPLALHAAENYLVSLSARYGNVAVPTC